MMSKINNIIRKAGKKVLYLLLTPFLLTPSLISCGDFLEIEPLNEIIMEKFWTEKADVQSIIAGCYSGMQSGDVIKRMMVWGEFRSENVGVGQNIDRDANLEKVLKENIDAMNGYTTWECFYSIINRCNTVLKYAPQVAANDPAYTPSELNANIAEVTALRALCYFYLIRTFRDVPYSTQAFTDDDVKMDLPATKFDAVLDSLISSLEDVKDKAVRLYPTTEEEALYQTGRITQDAIYAMLCEMYLWKKDYQNCIRYADLVIDSKKKIAENNRKSASGGGATSSAATEERFNGFPLISGSLGTSGNTYGYTYRRLFTNDRENYKYFNQEIIFQLVFDDNYAGSTMIANGAVNSFYGNSTSTVGYVAPSDFILDDIEKTSSRNVYADRNKKVDARLYENVNSGRKAVSKFVNRTVTIEGGKSDPDVGYGSAYTDGFNSSNWVIYRLTDIMLMKAEALTQTLRTGAETEDIEFNTPILNQIFSIVNAVNKRSVCQSVLTDTLVRADYGTKLQMETLVYQERQRELMFEGKRWYDLVRISQREGNTQTLAAAAMRKVTTNGTLIANKLAKMDAIYWPYNNEEIKVNRNLVQNSAFDSGENSSYEKNY